MSVDLQIILAFLAIGILLGLFLIASLGKLNSRDSSLLMIATIGSFGISGLVFLLNTQAIFKECVKLVNS